MLLKNTPALGKMVAHSALLTLAYTGASELLALALRRLPPALRPAHAWSQPAEALDLDDRRQPCKRQGNRRVARLDRRRSMTYAPRIFSAFIHRDRRDKSRGRRTSDWRYSLSARE